MPRCFTYFFLILFTLGNICVASVPEPDSVRARIDDLIRLSKEVSDTSTFKSLDYAKQALEKAEAVGYTKGQAYAMIQIANHYMTEKHYNEALRDYFTALDLIHDSSDPEILSELYAQIGDVFLQLKRYGSAEHYYEMALANAYANHDTVSIIRDNDRIGVLKMQGQKEDPAHNADLQESSMHLFYALYLCSKYSDTLMTSRTLRQIGTLFLTKRDFIRASYYLSEAIALQDAIGFQKDKGSLLTLLGHIEQQKKNYPGAISYSKQALEIRQKEKQTDQVISSYLNLANMYMEKGTYDSSEFFLNRGIELVAPTSFFYLKTWAYGLAHEVYLRKKDYKEALAAYKQYSSSYDCTNINRYRQEISVMEVTQALNNMERKNEALSKANEIQRLELRYQNLISVILFSGIILFIFLGIFIYKRYRRSKKSREILEKLNTQLDKEITERKETEALLRASEQSYRILAENSMDSIIHLDERFNLVYCSPNSCKMYRYEMPELEEHFSRFNMVHPDFREKLKQQYLEMIETHVPMVATYVSVRKDGTTFWAEALTNPIYDEASGRFRGSLSVVRDVTERVQYEESLAETAHQKEVLLREIHHRVKNNFAILVSLMNMQLATSENENLNQLINDLQLRVRTMSLVHELLYRSENLDYIPFNSYIRQLANIISSTNGGHNVEIRIEMEPCVLNIEIALPLGLIVNELLTNSFKYAFKGVEAGEIRISLFRNADDNGHGKPGLWVMTIRDNGIGLPEGFNLASVNSLGSQIIRLLVEQIEGKIDFYSNGGAVFVIQFQETP